MELSLLLEKVAIKTDAILRARRLALGLPDADRDLLLLHADDLQKELDEIKRQIALHL